MGRGGGGGFKTSEETAPLRITSANLALPRIRSRLMTPRGSRPGGGATDFKGWLLLLLFLAPLLTLLTASRPTPLEGAVSIPVVVANV